MKTYWVSVNYATGSVKVDDNGIIVEITPIWGRWRGHQFDAFLSSHVSQDLVYREINNA
jgi:hypothetical protein